MKVAVLLSSFNCPDLIPYQVDSILNQSDVDVRLIVRDDGSSDRTPDVLAAIASRDSRVRLIQGDNIGVVASFFALAADAEAMQADFIAFADQDDVWPADRLARQCQALAMLPAGEAGLCFGGFLRVDADGTPMDAGPVLPPLPDKGALLSENQVPGCTMVLNRAAHDLIRADMPPPERIFMHDWWFEQVIAYLGTIIRIDDIVLHYRQHGGNLIGAPSPLGIWRDRLKRIHRLRGRHPLLLQVSELHDRVADRVSAADKARIECFISAAEGHAGQRLLRMFDSRFRRARRSDDLFLRLLLLTGYFRSQPQ